MRRRAVVPGAVLLLLTSVVLPLITNLTSAAAPSWLQPSLYAGLALLAVFSVALIAVDRWLKARERRSGGAAYNEHLDRAAAVLASAVLRQWTEEAAIRGLRRPGPLHVRWQATDRPIDGHPAAVLDKPDLASQRARLRGEGDVVDAVRSFRSLPRRQVIVIGEAGAGKSVLAILLTLGLLEEPEAEEPVPVLLSLASWRPLGRRAEDLHSWMSRRMIEDYPFIADVEAFGSDAALGLILSGRVLPLLDGLDEMPADQWATAIAEIDRRAGDRPFVLTCRGAEFERAVGEGGGRALPAAAVIELQPVSTAAAVAFVRARTRDFDRWRTFTDGLGRQPDGPAAEAMRSPLMVWLATRVYAGPAAAPGELLDESRFPDRAAVERHLLDQLIPSMYPSATRANDARRWFTFLAGHARQLGRQDIAWWRLNTAVPRLVGGVAGSAVITVLFTVLSAGQVTWRLFALLFPLVGCVAAAQWAPPELSSRVREFLLAPLAGAAGGIAGSLLASLIRPVDNLVEDLLSFGGLGLTCGVASVVIGPAALVPRRLGLRGIPVRLLAIRLRRAIGEGVSRGATVGGIGGFTCAVGVAAYLSFARYDHSFSVPTLLLIGTWMGIGIGVGLGVVYGFVNWLATPPDADDPSGPLPSLKGDRTAALTWLAVLIVVVVTVVIVADPDSWAPGLLLGVIAGGVALMGTAWVQFTISRCWLAARGDTPLRIMAFLNEAHQKGILRQAGAVYEFRHASLCDHLLSEAAPSATRQRVQS